MHAGTWLGQVGYTTPSGTWLARSVLPTEGSFQDYPGLLFLREVDLVTSLQRAVHWEQDSCKTIQMRTGPAVEGIIEDFTQPWSAQLRFTNGLVTDRDYHLIVAADGTRSQLRARYGGYSLHCTQLTRTNALTSSLTERQLTKTPEQHTWMLTEQAQANQVEDRHYSVFRGNARMTIEEAGMNGTSFQTWGEGNSMRFATVPMSYPSGANRVQTEHQVWFATTNSSELVQEQDPQLRKQRLMQAFGSWHHPIPAMMEATPVDEILLERAIAHKHCVPPVTNVKQVLQDLYNIRPKSTGSGPVMVFIGDAFMTVDPILAQGFTMGMEGAHALSNSVSSACNQQSLDGLAFDPYVLRQNLENRHEGREDRLVALLRATELVQALGQPPDYSVLGFLSKYVVRPAIRITPHSIKTPIFNSMLKYSLGK